MNRMNPLATHFAQAVQYKPQGSEKRKPHPLRDFFKRLGIPQGVIAAHIGYKRGFVNQVLNGHAATTAHFDGKLHAFAAEVAEKARELAAQHAGEGPHDVAARLGALMADLQPSEN